MSNYKQNIVFQNEAMKLMRVVNLIATTGAAHEWTRFAPLRLLNYIESSTSREKEKKTELVLDHPAAPELNKNTTLHFW